MGAILIIIGIALIVITVFMMSVFAPIQAEKEYVSVYDKAIKKAINETELNNIAVDIMLDKYVSPLEEERLFNLIEEKQASWNRK